MYDLDDKNSLNDLHKDWLDLASEGPINGRKALSLLLADNKITGWHASRVLSIDEITSQGLLAYTSDQGLQRMKGLCNKIGFNESDKDAVMNVAKRYLKKMLEGQTMFAFTHSKTWRKHIQSTPQHMVERRFVGL